MAPSATSNPGQPTASDCPGLDITLTELIALGRREARDCFGDSPLTLRGWVWEDRGAYDCVADWALPGDPLPPDWLYCAATKHARLTPVAYPPGEPIPGYIGPGDGPFLFAIDPTSSAGEVVLPNRWVEVIGRFNDPATALCELVKDPTFREECESASVVREAHVVDAP